MKTFETNEVQKFALTLTPVLGKTVEALTAQATNTEKRNIKEIEEWVLKQPNNKKDLVLWIGLLIQTMYDVMLISKNTPLADILLKKVTTFSKYFKNISNNDFKTFLEKLQETFTYQSESFESIYEKIVNNVLPLNKQYVKVLKLHVIFLLGVRFILLQKRH